MKRKNYEAVFYIYITFIVIVFTLNLLLNLIELITP
jgi:hypothetical protein